MSTTFGLTSAGFVTKSQQVIISEIQTSLQAAFGANINFGPQSVFGQIVGVFSEREALIWQLMEAIYASQYPNGAEGVSVDNILAMNNLKRLQASPTKTNPTPLLQADGITLYGLILGGTPGTIIAKDSLINTTATPPLSFKLDSAVTIAAAVNAVQSVFFSSVPDSGTFSLSIVDSDGNTLTTQVMAYNAAANTTTVKRAVTPVSGHYRLAIGGLITSQLTTSSNAAAVQAAINALTGYSAVTVSGSLAAGFVITWGSVSNPVVQTNSTSLTWGTVPSSGVFSLTFNGSLTTSLLNFNASASDVQAAINALTGFGADKSVTVSGNAASGYFINWGWATPATVTVTGNTTSQTLTPVSTYTLNQASTVINSVQANINSLYDTSQALYPFTDVTVVGFTTGLTFTFGGGTVVAGQPVSSAQPQSLMLVATNSLMTASTVVNMNVVNTTPGAPAQAVGSATCTTTGPSFVKAGTLTVIASPTAGWTSVTNQLDCVTGTDLETDSAALTRRATLLAAQANGPIQAIVEKTLQVSGVTAALGFMNLTGAAQQLISFASVPVTGVWGLSLAGQTTSNINFDATAAEVQTALRALTGFSGALVSGNVQSGFVLDMNGSNGGQAINLFSVVNNTTGVVITPSFGRPPKSFEIVVLGGANVDIAKAIYASQPAGILSYGNTHVTINDKFGNPVIISFSRPTEVPIYVSIVMITDIYLVPGDTGSGINPNAKFNPQTVATIQEDIVDIGNTVPIGGIVIGFGSNGLIGAFNNVPGIISYTLTFGTAPNPVDNDNIEMQSEQIPLFETFNCVVSYT